MNRCLMDKSEEGVLFSDTRVGGGRGTARANLGKSYAYLERVEGIGARYVGRPVVGHARRLLEQRRRRLERSRRGRQQQRRQRTGRGQRHLSVVVREELRRRFGLRHEQR